MQGFGSFLLRDLPFDAIQFCIYEQLRISVKKFVSILTESFFKLKRILSSLSVLSSLNIHSRSLSSNNVIFIDHCSLSNVCYFYCPGEQRSSRCRDRTRGRNVW